MNESTEARKRHYLAADLHTYVVPVSPKMLLETLCVVEHAMHQPERERPGYNAGGSIASHLERIRQLMDECERKRPTGSDGKHGNLHTPECGCAASMQAAS
jgi:hypothetical protein